MLVVATVINIVRTVILIMTRTVAFEANWTSISDSRAWLLVIFSACRLSIDSNFNCKILRPAHPGGVGSYGRLGGLTGCPESKLRNSVGLSCAVLVTVWWVGAGVSVSPATVTGFLIESLVWFSGVSVVGLSTVISGLSFLPRTWEAGCVCVESSPLAAKHCMVLSVCDDGGTLGTPSAGLSFSGRGLGRSTTISCSSQGSDKSGEQTSSIPG